MRALDLFSGAGGLSCGFEWAGGEVVGGIELNENAAKTFIANHPHARIWNADIRSVTPAEVQAEIGPIDVILGGPMCQGVSQRGPRDPNDPRNFAFGTFVDYVRELQPTAFLMENVPALASDLHNRALAIEVFDKLENLGYHISAEVLLAAWFGVPQLRYRLVVIGRKDEPAGFPFSVYQGVSDAIRDDSFTKLGDAILDLPSIVAGGGEDETPWPSHSTILTPYATMMREDAGSLTNHHCAETEAVNLERISYIPEGGNWHNIPDHLRPERFNKAKSSDMTTTYGRLHHDHPAYTITTKCGNVTAGAHTHPFQNRAISVREAARIQGYPDRFRFSGPIHSQYQQVGNSVPPLMTKAISEYMLLNRQDGFRGRLTHAVLAAHPNNRLPFSLAPRYKALFGQSSGAKQRTSAELP